MTDERMALIELVEKGADADLVRELLAYAAGRVMELEVEAKTGAPLGGRSPDRARADCGSVRGSVAGEPEPAAGVPGGDGGEGRAEGLVQRLARAGAGRP
jgi:hypothetical protein